MGGRGRGRGRGRGQESAAKLMLKRSAVEAGLGEDPRHQAILDLSRRPVFPDFLWHSKGHIRTAADLPASAADAASGKKTDDAIALNFTQRSASVAFLVSKQRELMERFNASPQFVKVVHVDNMNLSHFSARREVDDDDDDDYDDDDDDIARTSDTAGKANALPTKNVLTSFGPKLSKDERYIPNEFLISEEEEGAKAARRLRQKRLAALLRARQKAGKGGANLKSLEDLVKKESLGDISMDKLLDDEEKEGEDGDDADLLEGDGENSIEEEAPDYAVDHYASDDDDDDDGDGGDEAVF